MLATSRMWPSTRWMHAVWWRQLRAGAPARKRRLGRAMPFQTTFPHGRFHHVHAFSLRPIRRWPCLIRSGRAVEVAAVEVAAEVEAVVQVEVAREAEEGAAPEAVARAVVVKAAPAEVVVPEEAGEAAPAAGAQEAASAWKNSSNLTPWALSPVRFMACCRRPISTPHRKRRGLIWPWRFPRIRFNSTKRKESITPT